MTANILPFPERRLSPPDDARECPQCGEMDKEAVGCATCDADICAVCAVTCSRCERGFCKRHAKDMATYGGESKRVHCDDCAVATCLKCGGELDTEPIEQRDVTGEDWIDTVKVCRGCGYREGV